MFGKQKQAQKLVFLAGVCGATTWRTDTVIPLLAAAKCDFFNPQKEGWTPQDAANEARKLNESDVVIMLIDGNGRCLNTGNELIEQAMYGKPIYLVLEDLKDGTEIGGQTITGRELKDLNNNRGWYREFALRHPNVVICPTIEEATKRAIAH